MSKTKTVELHGAFMWDCDECGCENFVRAVKPLLDADEGITIETLGRYGTTIDECFMAPDSVECIHCGAEFDTSEDGGE